METTNRQQAPGSWSVADLSEAEAFVLYWTHVLSEAVDANNLRALWRQRHADRPCPGSEPLPVNHLNHLGLIDVYVQTRATYIAFHRAAFTVKQMYDLLRVIDRYDWSVSMTGLKHWMERSVRVRGDNEFKRDDELFNLVLQRHVIDRYGVRVWSFLCKKNVFYGDNVLQSFPTFGGERFFEKFCGKAFDAWKEPKTPSTTVQYANYTEIETFPTVLPKNLVADYRAVRKTIWSTENWYLLTCVAHEEAEALRAGETFLEAHTEAELVAVLAVDDFFAGAPTPWAVARLNDLRRRVALTPWCTLTLQGLAFWQHDFKTLKALECESPYCYKHSRSICTALENAMAGKFDEAATMLMSALGTSTYLPNGTHWTRIHFPIVLAALLCRLLAKKRTRSGMDKISELFADCAIRIVRSRWGRRVETEALGGWIFVLYLDSAITTGAACQKGDERANRLNSALLWPIRYLRALIALYDTESLAPNPTDLVELARQAKQSGALVIAADVAAAARQVLEVDDSPKAARLRENLKALDIDTKLAFVAPKSDEPGWARALDALSQRLTSAAEARKRTRAQAKDEPAAKGEFIWCLCLDKPEAGTAKFLKIMPFVRTRLKNGELSVPKAINEYEFKDGRFDGLLDLDDIAIKAQVVSKNLLEEVHAYYGPPQHSMPGALLRKLAARPNLSVYYDGNRSYYSSKPAGRDVKPLKLTCKNAALEVRMTADGGAEIEAPMLLDSFSTDDEEISILRVNRGDPYDLTAYVITRDYYDAATELRRQARGHGTVKIPVEGVDRLVGLYTEVAEDAPIAWTSGETEKVAAHAGIPRETATGRPCVRLAYKDGLLTATLAMRLCDEPAWSAEPGKGVPERLVVRADKSRALLVRDFAAETAAAAAARAVLETIGGANAGESTWVFDGVEEALGALAALHAAAQPPEPAAETDAADAAPAPVAPFTLEWPEGESLQLSSLVSHSAKFEGGETADYWLGVSGEFTLDDGKVLSFVDLLRSFDAREGAYVRLTEGRYLKLSAALARRVEALKAAGVERSGKILISPAALPSLEKAARETEADDTLPLPEIVRERIETIRSAFAHTAPVPADFKCQMRPYQTEGYEWLSRLAACGIGACLADDMGLGKTIEIIALLCARRAEGPSLVIVPASVTFNWRNEIARFAPELRVALVGQTANVSAEDEDVSAFAKAHDIVITSYGVLTTREEKFAAVAWNVVVLDEAQAIKNHLTKRAKSVKTLKAKFRVVATGTPIENRLSELWSLFDFINPGMLGGETRFARELAPHGLASPRLKRLVKPLILRRLKRDVLTDLPDKEEITVPVVLGDDERHAYEATRRNAVEKLESGDPENKLAILAELTRLRRFCCHPSLVMPSLQASAKLEALAALLGDLKASGHRALIFSQFVDYLAIVRKMLETNGWTYQYLDGATSKMAREKAVEAFQGGTGDFFLISLKAGGMGLNLTAANYVILLDPWWNPAVENQATDRAHRIGQRLPVTVYRLIAQDTIEEKVVRLHEKKTALAEDVLADGASALSAKAMLALLEQD